MNIKYNLQNIHKLDEDKFFVCKNSKFCLYKCNNIENILIKEIEIPNNINCEDCRTISSSIDKKIIIVSFGYNIFFVNYVLT